MIESLLVANRGEIACRIFRTARRLGIRTVAVFSDADASSRHVREADEAVRIGPAVPRESYLNVERILEAARATGSQAIHPGYGFLSENAGFAQACVDAGLIFVGPPPAAIAAMGSKIDAKARMRAAGVPVLPGYEGSQQELEQLEVEARKLGLPLIIKPAAGGGGKGMQIIQDEGQIAAALVAARRLAESNFGDGSLLLERFLSAPRHIEVQVFADSHGGLVHLGDRDCSIQRRHQKLIEEAPAPELPDDVRSRLRAAALVVARQIGYVSAGTVEFLFDGREFYFMEMNTRLQVEHTVTEAITGLDLVEWQLQVAAGGRLPLEQEQIRLQGHAIEARVCAEDPERDFLPSAGELQLLRWPIGDSIRVDAGFSSGDRVPDSYDSLLGKVISWAPLRTEAALELARALERMCCAGVRTNERWLARILRSQPFLQVKHSIAFLQQQKSSLALAPDKDSERNALALAALAVHCGQIPFGAGNNLSPGSAATSWDVRDGFIPNLPAIVRLTLVLRGHSEEVAIEFVRGAPAALRLREHTIRVDAPSWDGECVAATLDDVRLRARVFLRASHVHVWLGERYYDLLIEDPRTLEFAASASRGGLTTPLPGTVAAVAVKAGESVEPGQLLMVIEAMKMEHTITAPHAGTVQAIHFAPGDRVPEGSELLSIV